MEVAAARVLRPHLREGEASVGVSVDVVHTAATPPGATVTAMVKFVGREGKLFLFEVSAADDAGEIDRGTTSAQSSPSKGSSAVRLAVERRPNPLLRRTSADRLAFAAEFDAVRRGRAQGGTHAT